MLFSPSLGIAPVIAFFLLTSCRDNSVSSYSIPKEKNSALASTPPHQPELTPSSSEKNETDTLKREDPSPVEGDPSDRLVWKAPATWAEKALGPMRKGSFSLPANENGPADLSITAFPGAVGGELANINRWRGQVSLPPLEPDALAANVTRFSANGLTFTFVKLTSPGDKPQCILGALTSHAGMMWFFKLSGAASAVGENEAAFREFLKNVSIAPKNGKTSSE